MTLKEQIQISVPDLKAVELTAVLKHERNLTYVDSDHAAWDFYTGVDGQPIPGRGKKYEVVVWKPDLAPGETISSEAVREHFRALHAFGHTGAFTQWLRTVTDPSGYHATIPEDNACWRDPSGDLFAPCSVFDGDYRELRQYWLVDVWDGRWSFVAFSEVPSDSGTLGASSDSWRLCSDCTERPMKQEEIIEEAVEAQSKALDRMGFPDSTKHVLARHLQETVTSTLTRQREEIIKVIESFSGRDDTAILKDVGESAPFSAPCSRKTCNILVECIHKL